MVYAGVTVISLIACCYLLFRRANAIAPDVTPPVRLRRWTAAFFASLAIGHLWYLPTYFLSSSDDVNVLRKYGYQDQITNMGKIRNSHLVSEGYDKVLLWDDYSSYYEYYAAIVEEPTKSLP